MMRPVRAAPQLRLRASVGAVLAAAFLAGAAERSEAQQGRQWDPALDRIARDELRSHAASGGVIAVVHGDSIRLHAVGRTLHEGGKPVRVDQPFGTVSLRDVLAAFTALLLDADGTLDLNAPIRDYVPDLPRRIGSVTLAQLLSHTAGLDDAEELAPRRRPVSRLWTNATDGALFTEPGAIHSPSRIGTKLGHAIVADVADAPVDSLIERRVLRPAALGRSTFDGARAASLDAVPGYVVSTSAAAPLHALTPLTNPRPQLYATAGDLAEVLRLWMADAEQRGEAAWPAAAAAALLTPRAARPAQPGDSITFGRLVVSRREGRRELSYAAGEAGYGILIRIVPEARSAVVVLANATGAVLRRTANAVFQAPNAEQDAAGPRPSPERIELPADPAAYAGTYANGDRIVVLELRNGVLHWRDGDLMLPVRREGAVLEAYVADGRVAQRFRWTRDAAGRAYVLVDERAFRRSERR